MGRASAFGHRRALPSFLVASLSCWRDLARDGPRQIGDLLRCERAPFAGAQVAEHQRGDTDADESLDTEADGRAHAADLSLPAGAQDDVYATSSARALRDRHALGTGDALLESDAAPQLLERRGRDLAHDRDVVFTLVAVARMQHVLGPFAIVRQEQQAFGIRVEASDRIQPLGKVDEIDDAPPAALVARRRHDALRLVERDVPDHRHVRPRAVHVDARVRPDAGAERRDDLAVDAHASLGDEALGAPSRRDSAIREHLLQADHVGVASPAGAVSPPGIAPSGVSARGSSSRLERPKHSRNSQVVP